MIRLLSRPVPKARAKTVGHGRDPVFLEHPAQLLLLELLADPIGKQERAGSLHERPCLVKNLQGPATQRHPVLPVRLHPPSRYGPHAVLPIDLGPLGPPYLASPRRRQHQELERQLEEWRCRRCSDRLNGRCHLAIRQTPGSAAQRRSEGRAPARSGRAGGCRSETPSPRPIPAPHACAGGRSRPWAPSRAR